MFGDDARVEFDQPVTDIAWRVSLLSDTELKKSYTEHVRIMKMVCNSILPKMFGEGSYEIDMSDDGCDTVMLNFTCSDTHPDRLVSEKNVLSVEQHCPECLKSTKHRALFAMSCMLKRMFTENDGANGHTMTNECWTYDDSGAVYSETVYKRPKLSGFNGCSVMTETTISQMLHCPDLKTLADVKKHLKNASSEYEPTKKNKDANASDCKVRQREKASKTAKKRNTEHKTKKS